MPLKCHFFQKKSIKKVYEILINPYKLDGGSRGIRTLDPLIKSQMLYLLSQRTKYGCLGWVRTSGMSESKSDALPLGYEAIIKWWGDMDSNHGTRRNRFTVCRVWPLRYLPINKWCRQRESNPQPTDSYYYSFHYQLSVCSLDFLLTISYDLGTQYKVSTLEGYPSSSGLAYINTYLSPNQRRPL